MLYFCFCSFQPGFKFFFHAGFRFFQSKLYHNLKVIKPLFKVMYNAHFFLQLRNSLGGFLRGIRVIPEIRRTHFMF